MLAGRCRLLAAAQMRVLAHSGAGCAVLDGCSQPATATLHTSPEHSAAGSAAAAALKAEDPLMPLPRFVARAEKHRPPPSPLPDALAFVKATARAKFDETVEMQLVLGTDPRRGDHAVRGTALLPHGTGKPVRVAVFAEGTDADAARAAGAEVVGADDLIARIQEEGSSAIDFDKAVATPGMKSALGRIARVLGPRGLMPNPKLGTLTDDVVGAVRVLKQGRIDFRADRGAVVRCGIGKASFDAAALEANALALVRAVLALRPKGVKGSAASGYILRANVSATMGPGFGVSTQALVQTAQASR